MWYKMVKSAIGAVFNVKQTTGEIILGLPPIAVTSKVNAIKHVLKLNIFANPDVTDPLSYLESMLRIMCTASVMARR